MPERVLMILILFCDHDLSRVDCLFDQLIDLLIELSLIALDNLDDRLRNRMLSHEDRAAVLVRKDRRVVSISMIGFVTGCLATKIVQQSSYGRIDVS